MGSQANHLMMLLFLWATDERADAAADEDFARAMQTDDWVEPLSAADAAAFELGAPNE